MVLKLVREERSRGGTKEPVIKKEPCRLFGKEADIGGGPWEKRRVKKKRVGSMSARMSGWGGLRVLMGGWVVRC